MARTAVRVDECVQSHEPATRREAEDRSEGSGTLEVGHAVKRAV